MDTHIHRDVKSLQLLSGPLTSEYKAINSYSKFCKLTIVYALYLLFTKQKGCQGIRLILEYICSTRYGRIAHRAIVLTTCQP